ncbi:MAG: TetR family transcriptional regulator [Acidimicrobiales bacterium]|nr:TetR family transcriptional regulator [Acidimicrobiales bacterium]
MPSPRDDSANTRERLVAAAVELVAERGYGGATAAAIARRAGLTTGAIYSNYRTKDELVATAMAARHERLFQDALDVGADRDSMAEVLVTVIATQAAAEHRALLESMAAAARDPELADALRERLDRRGAAVAQLLDAAKAAGRLDPDLDTASLAHLFHLIGLGNAVAQALGTPSPPSPELTAVLERLTDALAPRS